MAVTKANPKSEIVPDEAVQEIQQDDLVPDYVTTRAFKFNGHTFRPREPITVAVFQHPRFENLIHTGLVKAVRR
jgi:hypothetical protein